MNEPTRNARRELRTGWARAAGLRLTERDAAILFAVGRMRVARTSDLTALFFRSVEPARDRLRRLFTAGYLDCRAPEVAGENCYLLTRKGKDAVLADHDVDPDALVCVRELPARHAHLGLINRARVLFTLACRVDDAPFQLATFRPEWELVRVASPAILGLLPDAIASLEARDGRGVHVAIEADLSTESPTIVGSKIRKYEHYRAMRQPLYGVDVSQVVVLAYGLRRLRALARAINAIAPAASVRFGDATTLDAAGVFGGGLVRLEAAARG